MLIEEDEKQLSSSIVNDHLSQFIQFLQTPSLTRFDVCLFLFKKSLSFLDPKSIFIVKVSPNRTFGVEGSYGFSEMQVASFAEVPIDSDLATSRSIRENRIVWAGSNADRNKTYSEVHNRNFFAAGAQMVVWPLRRLGLPVGAVACFFDQPTSASPHIDNYLTILSDLISLRFFSIIEDVGSSVIPNPHQELSDRESKVLELMGKTLTNHEIAAELDFSESTIRQDTMSIYRKMGVNGRAEAIKSVKKEEQDKDV